MNYPAALPHDPIKQIAEDLFVVHGCVKANPVVRFTRNMTVVRDQGELTLINPVRLNEEGLLALEALGKVGHVLRLGPMHGMDDSFYVDRYKADFWSFEGGTTYTTPVIAHALSEGGKLPFANGKLLAFKHVREPEGVILLERSAGILLTCDAIQSYATFPYMPQTNWLARRLLPLLGFNRKTLIGPLWIKLLVKDKVSIQAEFERLLSFDFDQLIAAHGTFLPENAHAEVAQAIAKTFE